MRVPHEPQNAKPGATGLPQVGQAPLSSLAATIGAGAATPVGRLLGLLPAIGVPIVGEGDESE
jgi:hypothetical protein